MFLPEQLTLQQLEHQVENIAKRARSGLEAAVGLRLLERPDLAGRK